jgi:AcrR family transcriptional regulator
LIRGRPRGFDRDEALRSAAKVFWEKGYEGASLDDLQAAMGVISPPSFYAAFGSKEKLFLEVAELYASTIGYRPVQALEAGPSAREGVEALLRESAGIFCGADTPAGCLVMLGAINCAPASQSVQDHMRGYRVQVPGMIRKRLERGVTEGDVPECADLDLIVSFYATFLLGMPLRARDGASRDELLLAVTGAMAAWDRLTTPNPR